jgi:cystathionine beta-lyase family protein involved in aluminum resistance
VHTHKPPHLHAPPPPITSLIKNPGGTFAPSGGYIIGKAVYVKVKRVCL